MLSPCETLTHCGVSLQSKMRNALAYILITLMMSLTLALSGCGSDDPLEETVPVAKFVSVSPLGGCTPKMITVTFDNPPRDVTVSAGTVTVAGKTATIAGPFTPGPLALTITWADGTQALNYSVGCHSPL